MRCPSCDLPMRSEAIGGENLDRCSNCGGEFCTHQALRRLLIAHAPAPDERDSARRSEDRRQLDAFARDLRRAGPGHYIGSHMAVPVEGLVDLAILVPDVDDE